MNKVFFKNFFLAVIVILLLFIFFPIRRINAQTVSTSIIWISDQNANTILEALPISKEGSTQSPFLVYDAASEQEIINFISQLNSAPVQVRVVETTAMTVPATFLSAISTQTGASVVRSEPIDEYVFNYWKGKAGAPRYVVVADQESFMPYASVYAHRQASAFVNTYAEAERLVINDSDIAKIVHFGTNAATQASLSNLASANGKTIQQVTSIDDAMKMLTPAQLAGTQSIVTLIHSADTSALTASQQYWKIAPIYAAFRNAMLVTVSGSYSDVAAVDASVDSKLNSNIVPNNGGADPGYLVVVGHWAVFPYRFLDSRFTYQLSADARYADRNNDGDYVPEIPFGRITAYDIGNAVLLMNKGLFFDSGAMKRGSKGVLASDWLVERETDTIAALQTMYGAANVYAKGDIEFSNSLTNNPKLSEVLTEAKTAEAVIFTGHGNPNYLAATNPAMTGQYIKNYRFYPPSFWWLNGCDTGSYYAYSTSLVSGALSSGAVNIMVTVDTTATHSSALRWYPGFLAQGNDIGTMIQLGLKNCESYYGANLNVNKLPQVYLIGDPLVNYPPAGAPIPVNHAPVLNPIGNRTVNENQNLPFTISATDPDGNALTYLATGLPLGATFSGRVFSWTPSYIQSGVYTEVCFTVSDGLLTDSECITITVNDVDNVPPTRSNGQPSGTLPAGTNSANLSLATNELATCKYSTTPNQSYALIPNTFTTTGGTSHSKTFTGLVNNQTYNYYVRCQDATGNQNTDDYPVSFSVAAMPVNNAPVLDPIGDKTVNENQSIGFTISATDPDGNALTYLATGLPLGATFSGRVFSWTPSSTQSGVYSNVCFSVSDSLLSDEECISITIAKPAKGDLNSDGLINSTDYSLLSDKWLKTTDIANEDLSKDGVVDTMDLGIMMSNWG